MNVLQTLQTAVKQKLEADGGKRKYPGAVCRHTGFLRETGCL